MQQQKYYQQNCDIFCGEKYKYSNQSCGKCSYQNIFDKIITSSLVRNSWTKCFNHWHCHMATFGAIFTRRALIWNQYSLQWKIWADQQKCFQINEILLYFAKRYKVIGPAIIDWIMYIMPISFIKFCSTQDHLSSKLDLFLSNDLHSILATL